MFGLSFWEVAIILMIALLVFGPKKLPELARKLGEGLREFRAATNTFREGVNEEAYRPPPKTSADLPPPLLPAGSEPHVVRPEERAPQEAELIPEPIIPSSATTKDEPNA